MLTVCAKSHTHIRWPRRAVTSPPGPFFVSWYLFRREKSWYTENDNSEFREVLEGCTALLEELC